MDTYRITHTEKLRGYFYIEADSPRDALDRWMDEVDAGRVDFSGLEVLSSGDEAELVTK